MSRSQTEEKWIGGKLGILYWTDLIMFHIFSIRINFGKIENSPLDY
jgi:hypothetical protein